MSLFFCSECAKFSSPQDENSALTNEIKTLKKSNDFLQKENASLQQKVNVLNVSMNTLNTDEFVFNLGTIKPEYRQRVRNYLKQGQTMIKKYLIV